MYEQDFDEKISHEPIYGSQIVIIKRLLPDLPPEKIYCLSSVEANSLINSVRNKYIRSSFDWLHNPSRENRYKSLKGKTRGHKVQAVVSVTKDDQGVSAMIVVQSSRTKLK